MAPINEMEMLWAKVNEGLSAVQREKVRLLLAAIQFARAAYDAACDDNPTKSLVAAKHLAAQYFAVVAELQRIAGTATERVTVLHMEKISRLLIGRGWHGFPSTADTVHTDMTRFRNYDPSQADDSNKMEPMKPRML